MDRHGAGGQQGAAAGNVSGVLRPDGIPGVQQQRRECGRRFPVDRGPAKHVEDRVTPEVAQRAAESLSVVATVTASLSLATASNCKV